ncbi:FKBP-type peptidyl-prolyl cis-trans isomerase [Commensalibacter melissae]|uniref:FKBP-type peptidyl-prolyl cis-trans isomerase n=1 Tax=Commensalibacter melissae TaxID=2070537 RepID=UPI0012D8C14D|nr:FKBP-type peptidyl-prolyl cis-trans isomerase [Commensalibacter melissae]MUH03851.1 FKBP-type peptidyl-prolyl cis-trans isomerase [Commensalibacter melissae]
MKKMLSWIVPAVLAIPLVACAGSKKEQLTPEQFMQKVEAEPGVKTLPSGLAYRIIQSGNPKEASPAPGDLILAEYEGRLPDGVIFDSSDRHGGGLMQMPVEGLIPGWMEALPKMHSGDVWQLYVPPKLGYGEKSMGIIPSNSPLIFKIHLVGVTKNQPDN